MDICAEYDVRAEIADEVLHSPPSSPLAVIELSMRHAELEQQDRAVFSGECNWRAVEAKAAELRGRADLSREVAALGQQFS